MKHFKDKIKITAQNPFFRKGGVLNVVLKFISLGVEPHS
jgi:hypothetical protein